MFKVDGKEQAGVAIFDWGDNRWIGATPFTPQQHGLPGQSALGQTDPAKENGPMRGRSVVTALCSTVHSRVWCHHT